MEEGGNIFATKGQMNYLKTPVKGLDFNALNRQRMLDGVSESFSESEDVKVNCADNSEKNDDDLNIKNDRKVFHSFRHTVITRLHTINSNKAHVIQLVGHEDDSVHFGTYTHDIGLKALQETVNKLSYDIDFSALKAPLKEFDSFINRWKKQDDRKLRRLINKSIK